MSHDGNQLPAPQGHRDVPHRIARGSLIAERHISEFERIDRARDRPAGLVLRDGIAVAEKCLEIIGIERVLKDGDKTVGQADEHPGGAHRSVGHHHEVGHGDGLLHHGEIRTQEPGAFKKEREADGGLDGIDDKQALPVFHCHADHALHRPAVGALQKRRGAGQSDLFGVFLEVEGAVDVVEPTVIRDGFHIFFVFLLTAKPPEDEVGEYWEKRDEAHPQVDLKHGDDDVC